MRIVKAGVLYFVLVFGAGFVPGTTRTTTPRSPHIGSPLCNRTCWSFVVALPPIRSYAGPEVRL